MPISNRRGCCTSRQNSGGHVSWSKLQPSFVYNIAQQWSVQLGGIITVACINAGRNWDQWQGPGTGFKRSILEAKPLRLERALRRYKTAFAEGRGRW
jgi:hypothetical protein